VVLGAIALGSAIGCSTAASKGQPSENQPTGCCCSLGTCRADFTQADCVSEAEFQGWAYKWHPGPCAASDTPLPR
jgi:hypothetical protein